MSQDLPATPAPFPVTRPCLWICGAVLVLAACVSGALVGLGQSGQAGINAIAAAVCGVSALLAMLPVWIMSRKVANGAAFGFLVGMLIRIVICAAAVFSLRGWIPDHAKAIDYWVAGWYLAVLAIEVKLISSHVLATAPAIPNATKPHPAQAH